MHIVDVNSFFLWNQLVVYRLVTSTETMIACFGTALLSMKLKKSVESLHKKPVFVLSAATVYQGISDEIGFLSYAVPALVV